MNDHLPTEPRLTGQTAIITGASSGIGRATALVLASEGCFVGLIARREDRLKDLADEIERSGGEALVLPTDITDRNAVRAAVDQVNERRRTLDILINNAGVMPLSRLDEGRVDDWEWMVDVNVKGVLFALGAVLPTMISQESGHVVNVGSVAGRRPFPGGTVYSATKFAVRSLSAGIQLELSSTKGIRVTDIQPGVVDTELTDHIQVDEVREGFRSGWIERRMLASEDVAEAILYAVTAPPHVNVNEILIRPTDQER